MTAEPSTDTPHRLDWNDYKGIARCTACSWTEVAWTQSRARFAHDQHQATVTLREQA